MKIPVAPKYPERVCWGCDKLCPAGDLRCGNGKDRCAHPIETDGPDWYNMPCWSDVTEKQPGARDAE